MPQRKPARSSDEPVTPDPGTPIGYTLADVFVRTSEIRKSLEDWQSDDTQADVLDVTNADQSRVFDFDSLTGHPRDVIVYTNGRS